MPTKSAKKTPKKIPKKKMTIKGQIEIGIEKDNFLESEKKKIKTVTNIDEKVFTKIEKHGYPLYMAPVAMTDEFYPAKIVKTPKGVLIYARTARTVDDVKEFLRHYA